MIELRDYQLASIEGLRQGIREGRRSQVLCIPTGGGKTVVASYLLREAHAKGSRAAMVVDRIALAQQTSRMLHRYEVPHGVAQGGNTFGRAERIQVISAATAERRGWLPDLQLLIVDECHSTRSQTVEYIKSSAIPVIGLTATPFAPTLGDIYQGVVNVTTTDALVEAGFLVPLKVYAAKAPDMTGAKKVGGEWTDSEAGERGIQIVGDVVAEWVAKTREHFGGPVKTLVFSATVAHGEELCRQFGQAGFRFEQISYQTPDAERQARMDEFAKPQSDIVGLVSCEALAKGYDQPDVLCGVGARPYRKSLAAHIQQIGRVMRPSPAKQYSLWLDHSGNYLRHMDAMLDFFAHGVDKLGAEQWTETPKEPTEKEKKERACPACGWVFTEPSDACPACGLERPKRNVVVTKPGTMEQVQLLDDRALWRQFCRLAYNETRGDAERARKMALARFRASTGAWPRSNRFDPCYESEIDRRVEGKFKYQGIKWARSKRAGR